MKALNYITVLALFTLGSCTSSLYTGVEYDDLYYSPSDQPVVRVKTPPNQQIAEGNLRSRDYYDNIYAADTLVSDEYSDAVENNRTSNQNLNNYYDDYSYAGRLSRFHGNYFNPYWRDPFYSSWGFPSMSFNFGGYPYGGYYNPYSYDPFYSDYGYYGGSYGGYYGGFYNPYYGGGYYGYGYNPYSFYSPFYGNYFGSNYRYNDGGGVQYGRRERQSNYSSDWNSRVMPGSATSRRDSYLSRDTYSRRSASPGTGTVAADARRGSTTVAGSRQVLTTRDAKAGQNPVNNNNTGVRRTESRTSVVSRPAYNSTNRTYTPSYNNPRMSTRPTYNNSRVNTDGNSGRSSYPVNAPGSTVRSRSSISSVQRSSPSYNNSGTYSVPSRRSVESGSNYSSGSSNNSRSSYSGDSGSRSYSSGGSSYSSGSSSGGSSSGSSNHSSSSGSTGRR